MLQILDFIWEFLQACWWVITSLVQYVIDLLADISYMIQVATRVVDVIPGYFMWLPSSVFALLSVIFALVIIFKIIGREG